MLNNQISNRCHTLAFPEFLIASYKIEFSALEIGFLVSLTRSGCYSPSSVLLARFQVEGCPYLLVNIAKTSGSAVMSVDCAWVNGCTWTRTYMYLRKACHCHAPIESCQIDYCQVHEHRGFPEWVIHKGNPSQVDSSSIIYASLR